MDLRKLRVALEGAILASKGEEKSWLMEAHKALTSRQNLEECVSLLQDGSEEFDSLDPVADEAVVSYVEWEMATSNERTQAIGALVRSRSAVVVAKPTAEMLDRIAGKTRNRSKKGWAGKKTRRFHEDRSLPGEGLRKVNGKGVQATLKPNRQGPRTRPVNPVGKMEEGRNQFRHSSGFRSSEDCLTAMRQAVQAGDEPRKVRLISVGRKMDKVGVEVVNLGLALCQVAEMATLKAHKGPKVVIRKVAKRVQEARKVLGLKPGTYKEIVEISPPPKPASRPFGGLTQVGKSHFGQYQGKNPSHQGNGRKGPVAVIRTTNPDPKSPNFGCDVREWGSKRLIPQNQRSFIQVIWMEDLDPSNKEGFLAANTRMAQAWVKEAIGAPSPIHHPAGGGR